LANNTGVEVITTLNRAALDALKMEVAQELGIHLDAYNGDKISRDMGLVGGNMVKKLIQMGEQSFMGRGFHY
jgi:hypothetical protein